MIDSHLTVPPGYRTGLTFPLKIASAQTVGDNVVVTNEGPTTVYLGGQYVTARTGVPLIAGAQLDIPSPSVDIYAVSDPGDVGTINASLSSTIESGQSTLPVVTGGDLFNGIGWLMIDDGPATEVITPNSGSTSTSVYLEGTTKFAHSVGVTVIALVGPVSSTVHVIAGA